MEAGADRVVLVLDPSPSHPEHLPRRSPRREKTGESADLARLPGPDRGNGPDGHLTTTARGRSVINLLIAPSPVEPGGQPPPPPGLECNYMLVETDP